MQNEYKTISSTSTFEYAHLHIVAFVWQNFDFHIPFNLVLVFIFHFVCLFVCLPVCCCYVRCMQFLSTDRSISIHERKPEVRKKTQWWKRKELWIHFTSQHSVQWYRFIRAKSVAFDHGAFTFFSTASLYVSIIFQRIGMIFFASISSKLIFALMFPYIMTSISLFLVYVKLWIE